MGRLFIRKNLTRAGISAVMSDPIQLRRDCVRCLGGPVELTVSWQEEMDTDIAFVQRQLYSRIVKVFSLLNVCS